MAITSSPFSGPLRLATAAAIFVLTASTAAAAQSGINVVLGLGYEQGGPGPSLVDAMDVSGFGIDRARDCIRCAVLDYPLLFREGIGAAAFIGFAYRPDLPLSVEVLLSNGDRGQVEGYNGLRDGVLVVTYTSYLVESTVSAHLGPLRIGAGPVVGRMNWKATRSVGNDEDTQTSAAGITATAGLSLPLPDGTLSLRGGVRRFAERDLPDLGVPLSFRYESWFSALSFSFAIR